ncbi:hypothetical protein A0J61_10928 [Choanephora cucurbitarum]|uniref:Mitochondrial fission protein ELM1 n=1 Tax=Choanephora cucurbitarum TaxID=101091 RepID=A0A1C7N106_9FUNG|nr:hypothetical protein A0J61_10928 [Choanephora cucurbitarum]
MFRQFNRINPAVSLARAYSTAKVWVVTDGGLESSLRALTLGRQLANGSRLELKTIVASKTLQFLPPILQKYMVDWNKTSKDRLPWYLSSPDPLDLAREDRPDYIVASGQDAVPACLYLSRLNPHKGFSIYLGYPNIPFIHFDQVILPKYEANAKMAALGPLARQRNGIILPAPLLDTAPSSLTSTGVPFTDYSTVVVGGHSPHCRWYSEDAVHLAENIKRMIHHLDDRVVIVYTDRTPQLVKDKMAHVLSKETESVFMWDSTHAVSAMHKLNIYEGILHASKRVILTADLDYASAHAASRNKPIYTVFGGQCRSYLNHFHRWLLDSRLARKLRLDRTRSTKHQDPYSYLGTHPAWGNPAQVFQIKQTMAFVKKEIEALQQEKMTGKRRS